MANEIPDDVVFMILSKLPLKSLKRFTCVHKSWAHLLENPNFLSNFLSKHHSYYHDTSLDLLVKTHWTGPGTHPNALYLLSGDEFEKGVKFVCSPLFQDNDMQMTIFGHSIRGVFCLHGHMNAASWNPATEEFRILPPSPEEYRPNWYRRYFYVSLDPLGFGYDPVRDDFKVIRILTQWPPSQENCNEQDEPMPDPSPYTGPFCEIYSLRSNSWRKLYIPIVGDSPNPDCDHDVYMNGVCHWIGPVDDYCHETHYLASFNLSNEDFIITHLPLDLGHRWTRKCLVVLNESIALISKDVETTTFHISILGELGVKESWTKLFSVGTLPGIALPIGVGKKGHIFFKKENGQLAFFDLSTQMLEDIVTEGESHGFRIRIYKENFLPIGTTEY